MFFTIRSIEGIVINVEDFYGDDQLLSDLISYLKPTYKISYTCQDTTPDYSRFGISSQDVFYPQSGFEAAMYQNVIRRAICHISTKPSTTVFICRHSAYLRNAHELLLGTIVLVPANATDQDRRFLFQEFPDFLVEDIASLDACLTGKDVGFGGEYSAAPGNVFLFDHSKVQICSFPKVPNAEHPDCPVYVAGRYFGTTDPRHNLHALSTRILRSKNTPQAQAKCFADLFIRGATWASGKQFDLITRVPSRPGSVDRLAMYMAEIQNTVTFKSESYSPEILAPHLLQCAAKYPKLSTLNYEQRKTAIKDAFTADPSVKGKRIVLLDDVQTTGATLNEAIRVLKDAGASQVLPLVLGYHPYTLQTLGLTDDHEIHCGACKSKLITRCNKEGEPFFGCLGWKPDDGLKHATETFASGTNRKLLLMGPGLMQPDEELQSENIWF